jgi:hypothetical protein
MRVLLALTLVVAVVLRAWSLDFGLDRHDPVRAILHHQQDEEGMTQAVLDGALRGDPDPGLFMLWGSAGYYVFGAAAAAVFWPMSWTHPGGWDGLLSALADNPSDVHLVHRGVSVLASVLMVLVVARMARRLGGVRAGLLAALIVGTCYLHAREAHFGVLDTLSALFIVLTVDACLALAASPTAGRYVRAGGFAGLAAATKYFGGTVALCVVAAHVAARVSARRSGGVAAAGADTHPAPPFGRLVLAGAAAVGAFLLASPHVFFAFDALRDALVFQRETIAVRTDLASLAGVAWHHLRHTFAAGFGEVAFPAALLGGIVAWRAGGRARLLVICLLLLLPMFFVARSRTVRYGIAHVSLFSVLVALVIEALLRAPGRTRALAVGLLALVLMPSLVRIVAFDRALGGRDTRQDVLDFIVAAGVPPGELVAVGSYGLPRPSFMRERRQRMQGSLPYLDYLRMVNGPLRVITREEGRAMRPRYLIYDHTAKVDPFGWDDFARLIGTEYDVVLDLDARSDPEAALLPDLAAGTPSFLLPFDNPWVMSRPGPPVTIYERVAP